MKNQHNKVKVDTLVKSFITLGKRREQLRKENLELIFETNSGTTQINPSPILKELKKTLALVTSAHARGNKVLIICKTIKTSTSVVVKKWKTGLLSNFKEVTKFNKERSKQFPVLVVTISSKEEKERNGISKETSSYRVPAIFFSNTDEKPNGLFNVLANNANDTSIKKILSLLQRAINVGVLKAILRINPITFPRLDSNQRPRT